MSISLIELSDEWALWSVAAVRGAGLPIDWLERLALPHPDEPEAANSSGQDGLAELLGEPLFAAALTWQNPAVVNAWVGALIESGPNASEARRIRSRRAGLLARYAQRYCAKNETIGFFGSVGWARLSTEQPTELVVAGSGGIRRGEVFFEYWAVQSLARAFEADDRVWPYLPVRRHPAVWIDGRTARRPLRPQVELDTSALTVLDQVATGRVAGEIEPRSALVRLRDAGVVLVGFSVPVGQRPEDELRAQLTAITDGPLRDELLGRLSELDRVRRSAADALTDPVRLGSVLAELDELFTRHTGQAPRRGKAHTEAGRTLVYPDCRRDLDVTIGAPLLHRLAAPLSLVLHTVRWITAQIAQAVDERLIDTYTALRQRGEVTLAQLQFASAETLAGGAASPVPELLVDFRSRWAEVVAAIQHDPEAEEVYMTAAAAAGWVRALFPDPGDLPAWAAARHHSPDLMLARSRGELRWVLGELHVAMNTLENRCFHTMCDNREELFAATAVDMAAGRVVPCYPPGPLVDSRRYPPLAVHVPDRYLYWSYGADTGPPRGATSLPAAGLMVTWDGAELCAGPANASWRLPVREFFGEFLSALSVNCFRLDTDAPYEPRLVIDELVLRRRGWRIAADTLPSGLFSRHGYRWQVLADHLGAIGLPRHLFARSPAEPKPFYVDVCSPLLVTNLARSWRRLPDGVPIELREMLPTPDQLWFADPEGRRYTTEIRMVAVDRRPAARSLPGTDVLS